MQRPSSRPLVQPGPRGRPHRHPDRRRGRGVFRRVLDVLLGKCHRGRSLRAVHAVHRPGVLPCPALGRRARRQESRPPAHLHRLPVLSGHRRAPAVPAYRARNPHSGLFRPAQGSFHFGTGNRRNRTYGISLSVHHLSLSGSHRRTGTGRARGAPGMAPGPGVIPRSGFAPWG